MKYLRMLICRIGSLETTEEDATQLNFTYLPHRQLRKYRDTT